MLFKQAKIACRAIGIRLSRKDGEYRVAHDTWVLSTDEIEASAYYTTDLQDAVNTAELMHKWATS